MLALTFTLTKETDKSSHKMHTQNDNPINCNWKDKKLSMGNIIKLKLLNPDGI